MHFLSRRGGGDEFRDRLGNVLLGFAIADRGVAGASARRNQHATALADYRWKARALRRLAARTVQENDNLAPLFLIGGASLAILEFDAAGVDEFIDDAHRSNLPRRRHHFF